LSTTLINLMERLEGRRLKAYDDPEGNARQDADDAEDLPSIGLGHKITVKEFTSGIITINGDMVEWRRGLTDKQVDCLCEQDLKWAAVAVDKLVKVPLSAHQRAALISFAYNVGAAAFANSTLLHRLNAGEYRSVPGQLLQWVNKTVTENGVKCKVGPPEFTGLLNRRKVEIKEWLTIDDITA
jgi:lysozyme